MQFLTDTKIPFLKYRRLLVWVSFVAMVLSIVAVFGVPGITYGIDFKGGTQLTVRMRDAVDANDLRNAVDGAGIREAQIQQYGPAEAHEFLIRVPLTEDDEKKKEEGSGSEIIRALDAAFNRERGSDLIDLNQRGSSSFAEELFAADPDGKKADLDAAHAHYAKIGDAIVAKRKEVKLFTSWDQVAATPELSPAALGLLKQKGALGTFQVIQNESVGSQIGSELRQKGFWAVALSLLAMLAYIWYRYELRFGIGALVASFHDLIVTLGLFVLMGYEFNLNTIAAFLTLVGFSVNDTVVIFDRVRENMRRFRRLPLEEIMNVSVNETLPRTLMTSGTALTACIALFVFGGEVLRGFSFVMLVGVIVGTYSSIFIASPFALWWDDVATKRKGVEAPKPANI